MKTQGKVFKYPDNVDTDVIIPARYLNTSDAKELAKHCMEDIDTAYVSKVQPGDVMVAGWNFGCGSSREHAPLVIKTCGTGVVIAKSFARIHAANLINAGILPLTFRDPADYEKISQGDKLRLSNILSGMQAGELVLTDENNGAEIALVCDLTQRQIDIVTAGGLLNYTKENG